MWKIILGVIIAFAGIFFMTNTNTLIVYMGMLCLIIGGYLIKLGRDKSKE